MVAMEKKNRFLLVFWLVFKPKKISNLAQELIDKGYVQCEFTGGAKLFTV